MINSEKNLGRVIQQATAGAASGFAYEVGQATNHRSAQPSVLASQISSPPENTSKYLQAVTVTSFALIASKDDQKPLCATDLDEAKKNLTKARNYFSDAQGQFVKHFNKVNGLEAAQTQIEKDDKKLENATFDLRIIEVVFRDSEIALAIAQLAFDQASSTETEG